MKTMIAATLAASVLLAGCAAPGYQPYGHYGSAQPQYTGYNQYPSQPRYTTAQYGGTQPQYAGAGAPSGVPCQEVNVGHLIGGIAGGLLGAQVGKGNGRTAAAAVGAVTGAIAGGSLGKDPNCR